jgi:hypothetical protein
LASGQGNRPKSIGQLSYAKAAQVTSVPYLMKRAYQFRDTLSHFFFPMKHHSNLVDKSTDKASEYAALKIP